MKQAVVVLSAAVVLLAGCTGGDTEARARQAAEKIKESIPDVEAKALAQAVTPEEVREAQAGLAVAKEYLGEVNGKLDSVTVNAIEAFQRAHRIQDDGILNAQTKAALKDVLAKK